MNRILSFCVVVLALLVGWSRLGGGRNALPLSAGRVAGTIPAHPAARVPESRSPEAVRETLITGRGRSPPPPDSRGDPLARLAIRQRLHREAAGTYFDSLLAQTDSLIRRWADRDGRPLIVAVQASTLPGLVPRHREILREALGRWERLRLGVQFTVVGDTAGSDIVVEWMDRFGDERSGQADVTSTSDGRILHAHVTLALRTLDGALLPFSSFEAVATHEVGHALGLSHSGNAEDVMFPTTRTADLSPRDRSTAALLYRLPLGSAKQ